MSSGDATPEAEAEAPLLDDVVKGSIDFNGRPSRRSRSGGWSSAAFIIVMELAERFGYYGINSNLISYLTGPLGQSTAAAAANVNAWTGTAFLLPLAGAFVADSFWGRYRTIIVASLLFITGLGFLSLSAAFHSFNSSSCNLLANGSVCSPPLIEVVVFFFSLYLVALAEGGHRPCVQAFGADQYDGEDETESKTKSSFFNWWYFSMHGSSIVALLVLNYIQENLSWELGFGLPCIVMCVALLIFLLGSRRYRFHINRDERNPFVRIGRVFVKAARNQNAATQTTDRFLDRAIYTYDGSDVCSTRDVDDAKAILQLLPIWYTCWGYAVLFSQLSSPNKEPQ